MIMLVARDPRFVVTTPPPTRVELLASLSNLAASVPPAAWAAVGLGSVMFLLAVAFFIHWLRTRGTQEVEKEEVKEKSQIVMLSELMQEDPDLRIALEVARARRLHLADL